MLQQCDIVSYHTLAAGLCRGGGRCGRRKRGQLASRGCEAVEEEERRRGSRVGVKGVRGRCQPGLLLVLDAPDGLDLGALAVGAPVPPLLVVSAVPLTLHDVLLAPVARVLVAHEAAERGRSEVVNHLVQDAVFSGWC